MPTRVQVWSCNDLWPMNFYNAFVAGHILTFIHVFTNLCWLSWVPAKLNETANIVEKDATFWFRIRRFKWAHTAEKRCNSDPSNVVRGHPAATKAPLFVRSLLAAICKRSHSLYLCVLVYVCSLVANRYNKLIQNHLNSELVGMILQPRDQLQLLTKRTDRRIIA